jgi:hypothetical protein
MNEQNALFEDQKPQVRRLRVRVRRTPGQCFHDRVELVLRAFAGARIVEGDRRGDSGSFPASHPRVG